MPYTSPRHLIDIFFTIHAFKSVSQRHDCVKRKRGTYKQISLSPQAGIEPGTLNLKFSTLPNVLAQTWYSIYSKAGKPQHFNTTSTGFFCDRFMWNQHDGSREEDIQMITYAYFS